jgi:4-hydroxy-2-oxoheptanedioate aldolase
LAELRSNRAKHKLQDGGVATVVSGHVTGDMIEFLGQFGFEGIWIETEHGPIDYADIPDLSRACDLWGMTPVVRVNLNLPGVIYRTLDVGAQAIVVPHVDTAEDARAVVSAAKFYPMGARGNYTSRQGIGVDDFALKANDETMVVVLIEDVKAIDNLAEILAVDNIDVFFVAPGDLAQSMGLLGQATHPDVLAAVDGAIEQITGAGRVAGTVVNDSNVESYIEKGVRMVMTSWTAWVATGGRAYLDRVAAASK